MTKTSLPQSSSGRLGKTEHVVSALILVMAALSTLAALPVFRFGVWRDSEPTVIATFAIGGLAWIWSGYLVHRYRVSRFPLTLGVCLLFALWCSFTSLFGPFPVLSFLGGPQLGEGPVLFFSWSGVMLLTWIAGAWQSTTIVRAALGAAIFMVLYTALAFWLGGESDFRLFAFSDYIGIYAILLPGLIYGLLGTIAVRSLVRFAGVLTGYCVAVILALSGQNAGAGLALILGGIIWIAGSVLFSRGRPGWQRAGLLASGVVAVAMPVSVMVGLWLLGRNLDIGVYDSASGLYHSLYSMVSRGLMMSLTSYAIADGSPWSFLTGEGFGHSLFYIQNYLPFSGQSFLVPRWDVFYHDFVHTHSIPYEILLSGGVVALTLYLAIFVVWIKEAPKKHSGMVVATALAYLAIVSIWFEFAPVILLLAIVMGVTLPRPNVQSQRRSFSLPSRMVFILSVMIGLAVCVASGWLYLQNRGLDPDYFVGETGEGARPIPDDGMRGDVSLQRALLDACRSVAAQENPHAMPHPQLRWCEALVNHARHEIAADPKSSLVLAYLVVASDFSSLGRYAPLVNKEVQHGLLRSWGEVAAKLIDVAPYRVDILVPYFSHMAELAASSDAHQQYVRILRAYARQYPENPIVLWFNGQRKLRSDIRGQMLDGVNDMIAAIEKHQLDRFISFPDDLLAKLLAVRDRLLAQ
ncbi:hypothetical protein LPB41_21415 [Thalassospira sp. MA62]|nr:hypothetical protein [Thalassospira sp. MA62]